MNEGLIPRRYAKALYKVAVERNQGKRIYELMQILASSFDANHELALMVANPFVAQAGKDRILTTAAGASAADNTFADFLKLLAENRRVDMVNEIAHAFVDFYREENNIRRVDVVSAAPLDPTVESRIKSLIEAHLNGGTMDFTKSVNPDLIGGFVVNIDNERLDASLRNQLKELRLSLLN